MKEIKTLYRRMIPFLILGSFLFAAGCSSNNDSAESDAQDTLKTVLDNTFTGPDQKLNKLIDNPENFTVISDNAESKKSESPTELELYLEEKYEPHFTEDMYNEYVGRYLFGYQVKENNNMKVNRIDINQTETDDSIYDFTADIEYQKEGNEAQVYELKGQANFSEESKIKEFKIYSDDNLAKELSER